MTIRTEPIGSIPRTTELLAAMSARAAGRISAEQLKTAEELALRDTIARFEETGSPIITDGEQTKPSFARYPLSGLGNFAADGVTIPFADGAHATVAQIDGRPLPVWGPCRDLP
jgi:5-methyltetrahydropteroyltriglutamate--homocysteine methyltransferase